MADFAHFVPLRTQGDVALAPASHTRTCMVRPRIFRFSVFGNLTAWCGESGPTSRCGEYGNRRCENRNFLDERACNSKRRAALTCPNCLTLGAGCHATATHVGSPYETRENNFVFLWSSHSWEQEKLCALEDFSSIVLINRWLFFSSLHTRGSSSIGIRNWSPCVVLVSDPLITRDCSAEVFDLSTCSHLVARFCLDSTFAANTGGIWSALDETRQSV